MHARLLNGCRGFCGTQSQQAGLTWDCCLNWRLYDYRKENTFLQMNAREGNLCLTITTKHMDASKLSTEDLQRLILSALAIELSDDNDFLKKVNRLTFGLLKEDNLRTR